MKHFFITLYLLGISLFSSAQQEEKAALLITHYGSSDPQTRALTLDVVTREAQEAFPQFTVREAYISPIVRKRLAKEGVYKDSPTDALLKLRAEGYRTIYVQSTTLIEGSEMTSVRRDADKLRPFFKEIKVGNPLLYSVEDCEKVIGILTAEHKAQGRRRLGADDRKNGLGERRAALDRQHRYHQQRYGEEGRRCGHFHGARG